MRYHLDLERGPARLYGYDLEWDEASDAQDGALRVRCGSRDVEIEVLSCGKADEPTVLRVDGRVLRVELAASAERSNVVGWINGQRVLATIESELETRARRGAGSATSGTHSIRAPMPGRVVRVVVTVGDVVAAGDPLLGIEAMKMENELGATGGGVVSQILVSPGDTVEANQTLIVVESE